MSNNKKHWLEKGLFFLFFLVSSYASAQKNFTISGNINAKDNNESLIGATVYIQELDLEATTNSYGYYVLSVPQGTYTLYVGYMGYDDYSETITVTSSLKKNIQLQSQDNTLEELVINANSKKINIRKPEMSVNKLTAEEIKKMPAVMGEVDVLKSILQLPGVTNSGEGTAGFNVRGGGSDQNLLQLDESIVYNSSHLYGFFSVFNSDVIKDLKLYKGGIPARFGGRASSVLDIYQRNGNSKEFKSSGGIGLLSSRLLLEGPIIKDKMSFLVAGRASYAHLFLKATDIESAAYFYDLNTKINYTVNDNNSLFLSGYFGRDVFKFKDIFNNQYGNTMVNLRWNHVFNEKIFSNASLIYSDYYYGLDLGVVDFNWDSGIKNYNFKYDFTHYVNNKLELRYGLSSIYYDFNPGVISPTSEASAINYYKIPNKYAMENALYLEAEHELSDIITVNYGLRYSMFYRLGEEMINQYENDQAVLYDYDTHTYSEATPIGTRYYGKNKKIASFGNFEPRFAISLALDENRSLKASYNRMTQYIHLISNTTSATPLDVWAPSGQYIKPQIVDQVAVGYFQNLSDNKYSLEIESYFKIGQNRLDYIDGANLIGNRNIEQVLLNGRTQAYGLEILLRKNTGRLTGWIAYTISRSEQQTPGRNENENGINYGKWYRTPHDRTHDLSVVASYELTKKWSFSANFILQSGRPVTYPTGQYEYLGIRVPVYDERNNYSLPAFHHLDISATYTPKPDKTKGWKSEWVFGIYNVYNRKNAASISFRENEDYRGQTEAVKLSIFGVIPSVTYNFKF